MAPRGVVDEVQIGFVKALTCLLVFIGLTTNGMSQNFERSYSGQWAETVWNWKFHADGTYRRTSQGHFGNPVYEGTYQRRGDTVEILTKPENSYGTINHLFLLNKDHMLIDLHDLYDYAPGMDQWNHISEKRYDVLPKIYADSAVWISKFEFDLCVQECYTWLVNNHFDQLEVANHVQLLRVINTLNFMNDPAPKSGLYTKFKLQNRQSGYEGYVIDHFEKIPNRGMGWYFPQLQM